MITFEAHSLAAKCGGGRALLPGCPGLGSEGKTQSLQHVDCSEKSQIWGLRSRDCYILKVGHVCVSLLSAGIEITDVSVCESQLTDTVGSLPAVSVAKTYLIATQG